MSEDTETAMTVAQAEALRTVTRNANKFTKVTLHFFPFDLPRGYILARIENTDISSVAFEVGIAPDGRTSS